MVQNQQKIADVEEKYPRYRWVMVGLLTLSQSVAFLLMGGMGMLLPSMRADLGFSVADSGVMVSVAQLFQVALFIPAGLFLVRFRPKWVYIGTLLWAAVASFFMGRAPAFILLAVAYCFVGIRAAMVTAPDSLLRLQWIPKKELATVMGIGQGVLALGQSLGIMVIPFLLISLAGWRNLISVYSLIVLILAVIWIFLARERSTPAYQQGLSSPLWHSPLKGALKRKEFTMIGIGIFGSSLTYMTTLLFLPTYFLEEQGMALTNIGLITGLLPIGGVCANFVMGFVSDRIGLRRPTIWPAGLIQPFLYFALFSLKSPWALAVLAFVVGFVGWTPFAAMFTIPFELPGIKPSEVAVGRSLIQTITMLGMVVGAPLAGYLAESLGSVGMALRIICVFPLTMAIIGFLLPETGRNAKIKEGKSDKGEEFV
jgi:predicted MFS family arabinose efflux permease